MCTPLLYTLACMYHTKEVVPWIMQLHGCTFHCSAKMFLWQHIYACRDENATLVIRIIVYTTKTKLTVSKQCLGGPLHYFIQFDIDFFFFWMYVETRPQKVERQWTDTSKKFVSMAFGIKFFEYLTTWL